MRVVLVFLLIGSAFPARSDACSQLVLPHALDEAERTLDGRRPDRVVGEIVRIKRGQSMAGRLPDGTVVRSSCDDIGMIDVVLTHFRDDRTPVDKLGYRVTLVDGSPPAGFRIRDGVFLTRPRSSTDPASERFVSLWWIDGAHDDQEAFDFTFVVTAVDLAGHESEPSAPIRAQHPGTGTQ